MSWFFGSSKKKEPVSVTIDPTPIETECAIVKESFGTQPNPQSLLYPKLNDGYPNSPSSLPYCILPGQPSPSTTSASAIFPNRSISVEPVNQLESIPFRIAPQLQMDVNAQTNDNGVTLNEFSRSLKRIQEYFDKSEFDYDFALEKRILREAKMVNGHTAY